MPQVRYEIPPSPIRALKAVTAINVAVFVLWQLALAAGPLPRALMESNFLTSVDHVAHGLVWTLLTSEVSHISLAHLGFNMLALWVFGSDVERLVGTRGFLHLYVAGSIVASLGHVTYGAVTGAAQPALGASGAVMAIAVVSALLYPQRMLLLFFVIPLPAWAAIGLFILVDLAGLFSPGADIVAHAAHLGGALYGWIYYRRSLKPYLLEKLAETGFRRVLVPDDR